MKKRENIVIIVVLVVMVIAIVGVSYAAFNYSRTGSINTITTGAITMTYKETDNTINLTGALPTTDKTGMVRLNPGEYFDFSISSEITGDVNINYEISAKDITDSGAKKIDGKYIKLYLTKLNGERSARLLTPETYNEETSENTYTGRPANEMSLYTSSMNSSESNNYRLRMYVDEGYNPQGDGGNLQFTVQINVYGKAGEKPPTAVDTLLVKVNAEDLDYNSATSEQQKEMWTFTHPATEQTEALTDYRYIGSDPNNYVTFNNETWRIIGVFNVDDGTGKMEQRLKLIRDESIGRYFWNSNKTNDWPNATLNTFLNSGDYFTNSLGDIAKGMVDNSVWYLGGSSTYDDVTTPMIYERERGTDVYEGRSTYWIGKVGLMYPSDYGYATSGGTTTDRNSCLNTILYNWESDCYNNNWLGNSYMEWTITSLSVFPANVFQIVQNNLNFTNAGIYSSDVYPVVFLKANIKITSGDGSSSNPYVIS